MSNNAIFYVNGMSCDERTAKELCRDFPDTEVTVDTGSGIYTIPANVIWDL